MNFILGIKYPFYATQWHPEKNIFEWTRQEDISHSPNAIAITQYLSNFFVDEARKNHLKFPSETEEIANLIFRFSPVYSGGHSLFEQVYVFGNNTEKLVQWIVFNNSTQEISPNFFIFLFLRLWNQSGCEKIVDKEICDNWTSFCCVKIIQFKQGNQSSMKNATWTF